MSSGNPYQSNNQIDPPAITNDPASLTTVDWVIAVLCSGIGCIVGIVRLIQGKKNAGMMIGVSIGMMVFWNIISVVIQLIIQRS